MTHTFDVRISRYDGTIFKPAIVGEITIKRSKNAASTLNCEILRDKYSPEPGDTIAFRMDGGHDIFYGYIEEVPKSKNRCQVTANNTYTQNYGSVRADELFVRMCDDFGFSMVDPPTVANTEHIIPNVILQDTNILDTIVDALNITYEQTGEKYFVYDMFNNACLDNCTNNDTLKVNTFIVTQNTCEDYEYEEGITGIKNSITAHTKEENQADRKTYTAENEDSIKQWGKRTVAISVDDGNSIENAAKTMLEEKNYPMPTMSVTGAFGDPRVFGGSLVYVDLYSNKDDKPREFICGWFLVNSVTHHFYDGSHTMDLDLSLYQMNEVWNNE